MAENQNKFLHFCILLACISVVNSQTPTPVAVTGSGQTTIGINATGSTLAATTLPPTTEETTTPPESTTLPPATDLGPCICDLTVGACDVNCCCDEDCTDDDRVTFSECLETRFMVDEKVCLQQSQLIVANTPYTVSKTEDGLFCIEYDNYAIRNYYLIPDTVNTVERFDELTDDYKDFTYEVPSAEDVIYGDFYKSGDPIYTIYESLAQGKLGLSSRLSSSLCNDNNPAGYLYDESFQCTREITDLETQCETMPALSATIYYEGFKLVSTPYFFKEIEQGPIIVNLTTVAPTTMVTVNTTIGSTDIPIIDIPENETTLYDHPLLLEIVVKRPLLCIGLFGVKRECNFTFYDIPSPSYDGSTNTCENAIFEVTYIITTNGTNGIYEAEVELVLGNITDDILPMSQKFSSTFSKYDETDTRQKSGNPGYVVGEPLLAGNEETTFDDEGVERYAISIGSDRDNWLTVVAPNANGYCQQDGDRTPVTFGLDIRTGCTIQLYYGNMSDLCEMIQEGINNTLLGPYPPTHIGMFGNTDPQTFGDWVPILQSNVQAGTPLVSTTCNIQGGDVGICRNMVMGVHLEILYANTGSLANPQPKIVGATYRYASPVQLEFQCIGAYCQPGSEDLPQSFEVVSSVAFIDTSSYPEGVLAAPPKFSAKLPYDFFYPFGASDSTAVRSAMSLSLLSLITVWLNL
ncbi:tectonic-1-like [Glandiceps talaboti]